MQINEIVENMSIVEKVGQLFQVGISGTTIDAEIKDMIKNYHIGGIIYFSRNIKHPKQISRLSNQLQEVSLNSGKKIPLFISIDQEGGVVNRLNGAATHFPGNMTLGAGQNIELARKAGKAVARELKILGINFNLAPVLDVNINPDNPVIGVRSYGEKPEMVARLGSAYIEGLQGEGVIACAKHFPGHGDTDIDSHLNLPVIRHERERLNNVELFPFIKAIDNGVDSIMTAHIYYPALEKEPGVPATLSKKVLSNLLRKELAYRGLIITDCMEMKAIASYYGTVAGAIRTLVAGSDTVLISHSYRKQKKAIEAVIKAVKANEISEKRINDSVSRILKLKAKRIGTDSKTETVDKNKTFEVNKKIAREIAEKGITLVKGNHVLPGKKICDKKIAVLDFARERLSNVESSQKQANLFAKKLAERTDNLIYFCLTGNSGLDKKKEEILNTKDLIIVCTYNGVKNKYQLKIAEKLANKNIVIVLALRNPYDYKYIENVQAFITTYDCSPANQKAAADLLAGNIEARGKLPVTIGDECL